MLGLNEVQWISVPKFQELSVASIKVHFSQDAELLQYFPDRMPKGREMGRLSWGQCSQSVPL